MTEHWGTDKQGVRRDTHWGSEKKPRPQSRAQHSATPCGPQSTSVPGGEAARQQFTASSHRGPLTQLVPEGDQCGQCWQSDKNT